MKYILNEQIALRSFWYVPYAYYRRHQRNAAGLKKDEFELLRLCDGMTEIEPGKLLQALQQRGFCRPAMEGERLSDWQKPRACENRYFPAMNWMITGKCNFNCLHCFNAADNVKLQAEFTLEEADRLIREAEICGINAFTITGGEPMLHPHFTEIVRRIYAHGMYIDELNTNGSFLTQAVLDEMKEIGCRPLMKISFDGIGHHDWLRNREGAEEDALHAIRLCVENDFTVKAQTNVHRLNVEAMLPTAKLLHNMGVSEMRIIRTTEAPRWKQNAGDSCLSLTEYFDRMLELLAEYTKTGSTMRLDIWQFVVVFPTEKSYKPHAVACSEGEYRDSIPVCRGNRGMVAVGANGRLYPCHQCSGNYEQRKDVLGNVKKNDLQPFLQSGKYLDEICQTMTDLKNANSECASCEWFQYCCGGCRALALALTGDKMGCDPFRCVFFKQGYLEKLQKAMPEYKSMASIMDDKKEISDESPEQKTDFTGL